MNKLAKFIRPHGAHLAVAIALSLLYLGGTMEFLENRLFDLRFELTRRDAGDDIVLVAIDTDSLKELGIWPWPRTIHAEALDRLVQAGPRAIAYNVDFSSASFPSADSRLESSLAAAGRVIILPAFAQTGRYGNGGTSISYTSPLPAFARHSAIGSVNFTPSADGLVRESLTAISWRDGMLPSMAALLSGREEPIPRRYLIDYGIDGNSLPRISFADILRGRFDPAQLTGKAIIVGATAAELADNFPTPQGAAVPGSILHALAAESLIQDRALSRAPPLVGLAGIFLAVLVFVPLSSRRRWQWSLITTVGAALAGFCAVLAIQLFSPLLIDVVPWIISLLAAFALGLTRLLDSQTLDLLAHQLTIGRKEAFVQGLVDTTFDAVIAVSENGTIRSVNDRATEMFGPNDGNLVGRNLAEFLQLGPQADIADFLLTAARRKASTEATALRGDNASFTVNVAVNTVPGDDDHSLFVVLLLDVTALRKAQAEARDVTQRLTDSLESISEGISLWDGDDRLLTCNARFLEFHASVAHMLTPGCLFEDFVRDSLMFGAPPETHGREREWFAERMERHRRPGGRFLQQTSDGRWLRIVERHTGSGETICVETDVTEDQLRATEIAARLDDAEASNRAKSAFLANASHELRTPVNAILGFSEIIRDGSPGLSPDLVANYAGDIHISGSELLLMIDDILELSRIDSGNDRLAEANVSPGKLIAECIAVFETGEEWSERRLIADVPPHLPEVRADQLKLKRSLLHLINNAAKFTDKGGTIVISAKIDKVGGLCIAVIDKGRGMSTGEIDSALEPFGRMGSPMVGDKPGLGLGLALVDMWSRQHGGSLELASVIGEGTSATICLPAFRVLSGLAGRGAGALA